MCNVEAQHLFSVKITCFSYFFLRKTRGNTILEKITLKPGLPGVRLDTPLYCEADLCLCFRIGKNPVFSRRGSIVTGLLNNKSCDIPRLLYEPRHEKINILQKFATQIAQFIYFVNPKFPASS